MAQFRHFADIDGETIELARDRIDYRGKANGGKFGWHEATRTWLPVSRSIQFKSNPSRHECDARCTHAKGRTMQCECSCGGKNHGKGG